MLKQSAFIVIALAITLGSSAPAQALDNNPNAPLYSESTCESLWDSWWTFHTLALDFAAIGEYTSAIKAEWKAQYMKQLYNDGNCDAWVD